MMAYGLHTCSPVAQGPEDTVSALKLEQADGTLLPQGLVCSCPILHVLAPILSRGTALRSCLGSAPVMAQSVFNDVNWVEWI